MSKDDKPTKLEPRLRFPKFRYTPGWDIERIGSLGDFLSSLTGKSAADFDTGDATFVPYMNVFSNTFTDRHDLRAVNIGNEETQNAVARGDVFFTVSSENPEDAGMSSVLLGDIENCYLNSFCALFRFHEGRSPDPIFLGYSLRSGVARKHLARGAQGATRYNISKGVFRDVPLLLPEPVEQRKIADCLGSLDDSIAAETKALAALRRHKTGLMQQLFPRLGEAQPRLRFPEFRGKSEWRQRRIGEILVKKAKAVTLDRDTLYREIGVRSHGKGLFHKDAVLGSTLGTKRVFHVVPDALVFNIVFAWERAVAVTTEAERGFIASHRFPMFLPRSNRCDVRFMQRLFLTPIGKELLHIASPGGAGRNRTLSQPDLSNLHAVIPDTDEQRRIADCLVSLDTLLATQAEKLAALQDHKRGLMQQIFPAPDAIEEAG